MEVFCPRIRKNKTEQVNSAIDNETMTSSVSKKKNLVNISEEPPINLHPNMAKVSQSKSHIEKEKSIIVAYLLDLDEKLTKELIAIRNDLADMREDIKESNRDFKSNSLNLDLQDKNQEDWPHLKDYLYFCCDYCQFKCEKGLEFETHLNENHNEPQEDSNDIIDIDEKFIIPERIDEKVHNLEIECLQCDSQFNEVHEFIEHTKEHHLTDDLYLCKEYLKRDCDFQCVTLVDFEKHVNKIHFNSEKICEFKEETETPKVGEIKKTLSESESLTLKCDLCDKICKTKQNLRVHKREIHDKIKPFFCELCGKSYSRKDKLEQHIKNVHQKIRDYTCSFCDKTFAWENAWRQHEKLMHGGDDTPKVLCDQCDYSAKTNSQLTAHIQRIHKHSEQFKCNLIHNGIQCKASFPVRSSLTAHQRRFKKVLLKEKGDITKHPHKCSKCLRSFRTKVALKSHIVSLHSESGPETCQTCGKLFPHSISLRNHIIFGHPELSNIECDVCEQKFFSEKEMKRHKFYQHSDEGARCAICINVKFKLNSNLKQHYMNKHNLTVSKKYPYI